MALIPTVISVDNKFLEKGWRPAAFVEVDASFLNQVVPLDAPMAEREFKVSADKAADWVGKTKVRRTIRDYFTFKRLSLDKTKCMIFLEVADTEDWRMLSSMSKEALQEMERILTAFGYDSSKWLTLKEADVIFKSEKYTPAKSGTVVRG